MPRGEARGIVKSSRCTVQRRNSRNVRTVLNGTIPRMRRWLSAGGFQSPELRSVRVLVMVHDQCTAAAKNRSKEAKAQPADGVELRAGIPSAEKKQDRKAKELKGVHGMGIQLEVELERKCEMAMPAEITCLCVPSSTGPR